MKFFIFLLALVLGFVTSAHAAPAPITCKLHSQKITISNVNGIVQMVATENGRSELIHPKVTDFTRATVEADLEVGSPARVKSGLSDTGYINARDYNMNSNNSGASGIMTFQGPGAGPIKSVFYIVGMVSYFETCR